MHEFDNDNNLSRPRKIKLTYSLTYEETYDAFYLLASKWSRKTRAVLGPSLITMAATLIVLYAFNPHQLEYFIVPLLALAVYAQVICGPAVRAARGAKSVASARALFRVSVNAAGFIENENGSRVRVCGDRYARAVETVDLFALRADARNTFCLPKRAMTTFETDFLRRVLEKHTRHFTQLS